MPHRGKHGAHLHGFEVGAEHEIKTGLEAPGSDGIAEQHQHQKQQCGDHELDRLFETALDAVGDDEYRYTHEQGVNER